MFANLRRTIIIMKLSPFLTRLQIIVIVNSVFLQRPQKRSRGNQLIHRHLSKAKSIGSRSDPESQASRQSDGYGGWCLELRRRGSTAYNKNAYVAARAGFEPATLRTKDAESIITILHETSS